MTKGSRGRALLLVAALALAVWGLSVTLPHVGDGGPGYVAKALYPTVMWSLIALGAIAGLVVVFRR